MCWKWDLFSFFYIKDELFTSINVYLMFNSTYLVCYYTWNTALDNWKCLGYKRTPNWMSIIFQQSTLLLKIEINIDTVAFQLCYNVISFDIYSIIEHLSGKNWDVVNILPAKKYMLWYFSKNQASRIICNTVLISFQ